MAYLVFVISAQFDLVATQIGIDPSALALGPLGWGFAVAIGLFVSVLLHEFGHAFTAQAMGIEVRGITLMMLGGVSQMEQMPEKKYSEFKLSIVGPIVSLALAVLFFGIRGITESPDLSFFAYWLGSANLVLGIFNLLPAFPLDGGRALRSLLAARQGMLRATQNSVRVSKVLAVVFGVLGFLSFNIILMLIAVFVYSAAQSELYLLLAKETLKGVKVRSLMRQVEAVDASRPLSYAVHRMATDKATALPVVTEAKLEARPQASSEDSGFFLVALERIKKIPRNRWPDLEVGKVMEEAKKTASLDDEVGEKIPDLLSSKTNALPVIEDGNVLGVLSYADVSQMLQFRILMGNDPSVIRAEAEKFKGTPAVQDRRDDHDKAA